MKKQKQAKVRLSTIRSAAERMNNQQIVNLCRVALNARNLANCQSLGSAISALHMLRQALRNFS